MINVILVGQSRLFRQELQISISSARFSTNILSASFNDALELLRTGAVHADLIVGDLAPNFEQECRVISALRREFPSVKTVILTRTPIGLDIEQMAQLGISGLFSKDLSAETLKHGLELVLMGGIAGAIVAIYPPRSASDLPEPRMQNGSQIDRASANQDLEIPNLAVGPAENDNDKRDCRKPKLLSRREEQILECLVTGMSNKLIARALDISDATVKVHLRSLRRKLKVQNRTQAAIWSMQNATATARSAIVPAVHPFSERSLPRFETRSALAL